MTSIQRHLKLCSRKMKNGEIIKDENGEPTINTDIPGIIKAFGEFKRKYSFDF